MPPRIQFASGTIPARLRRLAQRPLLLVCSLLFCFAPVRAQEAPPGTVGRVEGKDISVDGGATAGTGSATALPSIFVASGSVVTVHSGRAHMVLVAGGDIEICGPAKFTLLQSEGAITVALNFGRVHVILPLTTSLRIFTPTIVATPLEIRGARRDVTIGLDLSDSMCLVATSGALRLEHQFTGEVLDVPQMGEFFLASGKLSPVAGTPGSCRCEELQARAAPAPALAIADVLIAPKPVQAATAAPAPAEHPSTVAPAVQVAAVTAVPVVHADPPPPAGAAAAPEPAPEPLVSVGVLADANQAHPVVPAQNNAAPDPPALTIPEYKIVMPPLAFSANSPEPPPDPTPDMIMLVRVARADPRWQFTGHVEAPHVEEVAQHTAGPAEAPAAPGSKAEKKKGGFWAKLKHAFVGG